MTAAKKKSIEDPPPPATGAARVLELAENGCTSDEIAQDLKITTDELEQGFADELELGRLRRSLTIREMMYGLVKKSNPPSVRYLYEHELNAPAESPEEEDEASELRSISDEQLDEEIRQLREELARAELEEAKAAPPKEGEGGAEKDNGTEPSDIRAEGVEDPVSGKKDGVELALRPAMRIPDAGEGTPGAAFDRERAATDSKE
jgi:hypothetical protein